MGLLDGGGGGGGGGDFGSIIELLKILASLAKPAADAYGASQADKSQTQKPPIVDPSQMNRALLPAAKANTAANLGAGISPEFLANLLGQESGSPEGALAILGDIRKTLGRQEGF